MCWAEHSVASRVVLWGLMSVVWMVENLVEHWADSMVVYLADLLAALMAA